MRMKAGRETYNCSGARCDDLLHCPWSYHNNEKQRNGRCRLRSSIGNPLVGQYLRKGKFYLYTFGMPVGMSVCTQILLNI